MTPLVLIASVIILFLIIRSKAYRTSDSLLVAFFLTTILAGLFWAAGVLAGKIVVIFLAGVVLSGIYSALDN